MIELQGLEELLQGYFDDECTVSGSMGTHNIVYTLDVPYTSTVEIITDYTNDEHLGEIEIFSSIEKFIELFDFESNMTFESIDELNKWIEENNDLFKDYENIPSELMAVLEKYNTSESSLSYEECEAMLKDVNAVGYTFEYGLDGVPFNLHKINEGGEA